VGQRARSTCLLALHIQEFFCCEFFRENADIGKREGA
jgi:hypothetical protein